jgi:large subunit ribosomal protein L18
MLKQTYSHERRMQIHHRIRKKLRGSSERPRLSVYRSLKHIYGQIIDDSTGKTLVAASTAEKAAKQKNGGNRTKRTRDRLSRWLLQQPLA